MAETNQNQTGGMLNYKSGAQPAPATTNRNKTFRLSRKM